MGDKVNSPKHCETLRTKTRTGRIFFFLIDALTNLFYKDDSRDATKKDAQENELGFVNADLVEEKMENDTKSLFEKVNNDTIEG